MQDGDGLTASSGAFNVSVDDSSIETSSDALRVKASGITNAMLAGSIANSKLINDSVTVAMVMVYQVVVKSISVLQYHLQFK